jgi:teichuronic acid biosynthesis glycosyltransferase TuaC
MRVTFLVPSYPSEAHQYSGVFYQTQAEALSRCGVQVEVLVANPFVPPFAELYSSDVSRFRGVCANRMINNISVRIVRYPYLPKMVAMGIAHPWITRAVAGAMRVQPDVIHAHFGYPLGAVAAALSRKTGVPAVVTLHGSDVNKFAAGSSRGRNILRETSKWVTTVAVSHALGQRTFELIGRRPVCLPVGIRLNSFTPTAGREELRSRFGIASDVRVLLYVGNLLPDKGLRELVKALNSLPENVALYAIGKGPLDAELKRDARIRLVGSLPNCRIGEYMRACDVFVLPSYSEGLPTVLVEAGAVGIPVVATTVGGIPELVNDSAILVAPRDSEALAVAIKCCLEDPSSAHNRAERLQERVSREYCADRNAERLRDLYASLCIDQTNRSCGHG